MPTDRNGLDILDRTECIRLLSRSSLGRIAVTVRAIPVILPVNFLLDGDRILIRTGAGKKLEAATRDAIVAFEVDDVDHFDHTGWSVCVTGRATALRDGEDLAHAAALPLPHWTPNGVGHVVAVSLDVVTGRRLSRGNPAPVSSNQS